MAAPCTGATPLRQWLIAGSGLGFGIAIRQMLDCKT